MVQHADSATVMTTPVLREIYDMDVHVEQIGGRPIGVYFS